jgi:hypothetical protein
MTRAAASRRPDRLGGMWAAMAALFCFRDSHDRWAQPLLRLIDTAVGVVIGLIAAELATRIEHRLGGAP